MQEGKAKKIEFYRYFSSEDVNSLLAETFSNLGKLQFVFLQPHQSNRLTIAKEQKLDGNAIFHLARNGVLYLQVLSDDSNTSNSTNESESNNTSSDASVVLLPDDDLPAPPMCIVQSYNQMKAAELQQQAVVVAKRAQVS